MSSSRSVAAARQRRAGTSDAPPTQRGPATSISSSQVFSQSKTKTVEEPPMSINKAITLITLRLSRIESIVQHMNDTNQDHPDTNHNSDVKFIGEDVINMIMERLDTIEKNQSETNFQEQLQDIEARIEESSDIIMKLQTFTMDTNQTLVKKQITDCVEKSKVAIETKLSKANLSILKLQASIMDLTQKISLLEFDEKVETEHVELIKDETEPVEEHIDQNVEHIDQIVEHIDQNVEHIETIKLSQDDLDKINYIV